MVEDDKYRCLISRFYSILCDNGIQYLLQPAEGSECLSGVYIADKDGNTCGISALKSHFNNALSAKTAAHVFCHSSLFNLNEKR